MFSLQMKLEEDTSRRTIPRLSTEIYSVNFFSAALEKFSYMQGSKDRIWISVFSLSALPLSLLFMSACQFDCVHYNWVQDPKNLLSIC